ncbi:MAG: urease accessory protein UreF, partial [Acidimicrobiales bacterium]
MTTVAALMLADGRLPAGGHAHSGGLEAAAATGAVHDVATLATFLAGRLDTAGRVAAGLAAAACCGTHPLDRLYAEADARTASPALRDASRRQGAHLARASAATFGVVVGAGAAGAHHHAVTLGAVARSAGLAPVEAARLAAYAAVTGPATAAVRLLGLDPFAVQG